jgi:hypothetical protein
MSGPDPKITRSVVQTSNLQTPHLFLVRLAYTVVLDLPARPGLLSYQLRASAQRVLKSYPHLRPTAVDGLGVLECLDLCIDSCLLTSRAAFLFFFCNVPKKYLVSTVRNARGTLLRRTGVCKGLSATEGSNRGWVVVFSHSAGELCLQISV